MNHTIGHNFLNQSQESINQKHNRSNRSSLNRENSNSITSRDRMGSYTHLEEMANGTGSVFHQRSNQLGSNSSRKRRAEHTIGSGNNSGTNEHNGMPSQFNATFFPSVNQAASGNLNIRKMNGSQFSSVMQTLGNRRIEADHSQYQNMKNIHAQMRST